MTASVNIKRGDLHLAVSTAFNRGRYVLMTAGDGQPQEITIDLRERPDDLFEAEHGGRRFTPEEVAKMFGADDHGPSVPAQDWAETSSPGRLNASPAGPRVYEFALQDFNAPLVAPYELDAMTPERAIEFGFADIRRAFETADWVHVYDRVTRERRTLKRPEPDRILTGLRDVAADLRGKPVDPPFGCAALPPVGPLTSTDGLKPGDVLRCIDDAGQPLLFGHSGKIYTLRGVIGGGVVVDTERSPHMANNHRRFAFVGRPDASGWMTWAGGENPVPGVRVVVRHRAGWMPTTASSDGMNWAHTGENFDIVAFRLAVDTPPAV